MNAAAIVFLAVTVIGGPDHMRAYRAVKALKSGERVIVAAPAGRTVEEAEIMFASAAKEPGRLFFGDFCAMSEDDRATIAKVALLGKISRVAVELKGNDVPCLGTMRPEGAENSDNLPWPEWVGVMPLRPYRSIYLKKDCWRAFLDFGTGPLGKDGARVLRPVFAALRLKAPLWAQRIDVEGESADRETYPKKAKIRFGFEDGFELVVSWGNGQEQVVWSGANGNLATRPCKSVPLRRQISSAPDTFPEEVKPVTETILLGCRAAMTPTRVTRGDCEKRYVRDGWEWEGL